MTQRMVLNGEPTSLLPGDWITFDFDRMTVDFSRKCGYLRPSVKKYYKIYFRIRKDLDVVDKYLMAFEVANVVVYSHGMGVRRALKNDEHGVTFEFYVL